MNSKRALSVWHLTGLRSRSLQKRMHGIWDLSMECYCMVAWAADRRQSLRHNSLSEKNRLNRWTGGIQEKATGRIDPTWMKGSRRAPLRAYEFEPLNDIQSMRRIDDRTVAEEIRVILSEETVDLDALYYISRLPGHHNSVKNQTYEIFFLLPLYSVFYSWNFDLTTLLACAICRWIH